MWADNETTEDFLGFKVHVDLILEIIKDPTLLPVSIGVFGDWGSGKSSILKMLYKELRPDEDELKDETLVLYFNGWIFEGYDDAKAALLESIVNEFEKNRTLSSRIGDQAKKLLGSINWMRVIGLGFKKVALPAAAAYLTGGASLIPSLISQFKDIQPEELAVKLQGEEGEEFLSGLLKEKSKEADAIAVREFRNDFKDLIEKSKIKKLIVIIDDLDRCTYDRIIDNLEAIKLFLNVENTAFIIGADPRIVSHAIAHHYAMKIDDAASASGVQGRKLITDYLEKLIQIPYNLPRLSDHEVETYLNLLFCKRASPANYNQIIKAFQANKEKNRYSIYGLADFKALLNQTEIDTLEKSIGLIASLSPIITEGLNGNPRQIKRFLNTFMLRSKLAEVARLADLRSDILAKLMVLEYTMPELFRELYDWQVTGNGYANKLKIIEGVIAQNQEIKEEVNAFWKSPSVAKWLKIEPLLGDTDLRDYFWLSRDQLFGSISGSSLVPAHIRSLFKSIVEYKSDAILIDLIENGLKKENMQNQAHLFSLIEKELITQPGSLSLHKTYLTMIAKGVTNAKDCYRNAVAKISNHEDIPFSLQPSISQAIKDNSELADIPDFFKQGTAISKAFNKRK